MSAAERHFPTKFKWLEFGDLIYLVSLESDSSAHVLLSKKSPVSTHCETKIAGVDQQL